VGCVNDRSSPPTAVRLADQKQDALSPLHQRRANSLSQANSKTSTEDPLSTALFSLETEKSVLGSFLLDAECRLFYEATAAGLVAEDFHLESNRVLFRAIADLVESEVPVDMITLVNYLNSQGQVEKIGGVGYIASLTDGVPDRPSIGHYVTILKEKTLRRQAVILGNRLVAMAQDPGDSVRDALAGTHEEVLRLQGDAQEKTLTPLAEITGTVLGNIERMMSYDPYGTIGIPFGLTELDEATTGMRQGQLIVAAAFPAAGKTSFAIDVARKVAKSGKPVGVFSREMLKEEVVERILSQESDVPYLKVRRPMNLSISEFRLLERAKDAMQGWPLYIDDDATKIGQMIPRAHLMIRKLKVELLVFDYIQIIDAPGEKEYERVSYVADALMALGKATGVPVLALSQLTRPEGRKGDINVRPTVGMLRSSGKIEQNSHLALLLYTPVDKQTGDYTGEDEIICGKQRAGVVGRIKAFFNKGVQRWEPRGAAVTPPPKQETIFANSKKEDDL